MISYLKPHPYQTLGDDFLPEATSLPDSWR
jgi:hypothetical protein